jgi:flavin reductase (DIM6/NTAB) family NADH-FMN oxidoreductase RutF
LGFVLRPEQEVRRHTYENLLETGVYTINHVHESFISQAHFTSAKFGKEESEFEKCGLTEEYLFGFEAPFVKESYLKMGLRFCEELPIRRNNTHLIIGEIEHLVFPEEWMDAEGHLNLEGNTVGISGLNSYYSLARMAQFPYARPQEVPGFSINPLNGG